MAMYRLARYLSQPALDYKIRPVLCGTDLNPASWGSNSNILGNKTPAAVS